MKFYLDPENNTVETGLFIPGFLRGCHLFRKAAEKLYVQILIICLQISRDNEVCSVEI